MICEIDITTLGKCIFTCNQAFIAERLNSEAEERRLQSGDFFSLIMEPGSVEEELDLSLLDFVWDLEQYDQAVNRLEFQINFTHPVRVSPTLLKDSLTLEVHDPSLITSKDFGKPIEMAEPIWTPVVKQMPNTVETQQYFKTTEQTKTAASGTTMVAYCLEFVFKGAMREIIGQILGLQIIVFGSLAYVNIPANIKQPHHISRGVQRRQFLDFSGQ